MIKKTTKTGSISRRRLLTAVGAGTALAVLPFRINRLQAQQANIKIGFPVPLTGPYGTEAQDQVRAGQLAVAQFNDAGGRMSANGMVRPCSGPASMRSWQGALKTRSTPCLRNSTRRSP
jgi:hypothetical protein